MRGGHHRSAGLLSAAQAAETTTCRADQAADPGRSCSRFRRVWVWDGHHQPHRRGRGVVDRLAVSVLPNKDAILAALMQAHVDADARQISERLANSLPGQLHDALRVFVRATIDNHRDNPRLHRVLFEEAPRAPAFLARLHESEEMIVDATACLLDQHRESGSRTVCLPHGSLSPGSNH